MKLMAQRIALARSIKETRNPKERRKRLAHGLKAAQESIALPVDRHTF